MIKYWTTVTDVSYEAAFAAATELANRVFGGDNWYLESAILEDVFEDTFPICATNRKLLECDFTFVKLES